MTTKERHDLSPTSILNHELSHVEEHDKNPKEFYKNATTKDKDYENKEKKRVITGSEQDTAKKLGEIKNDEITRKTHKANETDFYKTKGPTTTDAKIW